MDTFVSGIDTFASKIDTLAGHSVVYGRIIFDELADFVKESFEGDAELVNYFDKSAHASCVSECCDIILEKIENQYPNAFIIGVYANQERAAYLVYEKKMLISFGVAVKFRHAKFLRILWDDVIKKRLGSHFACMLYSYNTRAIEWLRKCGMVSTIENITILEI